jgi:hypothetical protein
MDLGSFSDFPYHPIYKKKHVDHQNPTLGNTLIPNHPETDAGEDPSESV